MLPILRSKNNSLFSDFDNFFNLFRDNEICLTSDENGNNIYEIEVAGFNKDNLNVELNQGILTIQGETDKRKIFKRLSLGREIEDIDAKVKDGILTITFDCSPQKDVKRIELKD